MKNNHISDSGLTVLAEGLNRLSNNFQTIDISDNNTTSAGRNKVRSVCKNKKISLNCEYDEGSDNIPAAPEDQDDNYGLYFNEDDEDEDEDDEYIYIYNSFCFYTYFFFHFFLTPFYYFLLFIYLFSDIFNGMMNNESLGVFTEKMDQNYENITTEVLKLLQEISDSKGQKQSKPPSYVAYRLYLIIVFLRQRIQQYNSIQNSDDLGFIPENEIEMPSVVKMVQDKLELLRDILYIAPLLNNNRDSIALPANFSNTATSGERCGIIRIRCVEIIAEITRIGYPQSLQKIVELQLPTSLIQFFLQYPWNNSLHSAIERFLLAALSSDDYSLLTNVVSDNQLTATIRQQFQTYYDATSNYKPTPFGYMGHLIRLSNCISHLCTSSDTLHGLIANDTEWQTFVDSTLSQYNSLNEGQLDGSGYVEPEEEY